jgi:hypothetical protein
MVTSMHPYVTSAIAEIVRLTTTTTPPGATHWSCRTMAKRVGVSSATVQRIWSDLGLRPHRIDTFKVSNDPRFEDKLIDVVGLYLNPPEKAIASSLIEGLRPRPSRILSNPANPSSPNRLRHARTVTGVTPTSSEITALATPSAAINNTFACTTCRCGADCARANLSNVSRSPSDNGNGAAGALITPEYRTTHYLFTRHTSRDHLIYRVSRCGTACFSARRRHVAL